MTSVHVDDYAGSYADSLYATSRRAVPIAGPPDRDEVTCYRRDGFLAVDGVLTPTEVDHALAGLADLVAEPPAGVDLQFEAWADEAGPGRRLDAVRKLMSFAAHDPRLRAVADHPAVLATVRRLLGTTAVMMIQDMALLKPPGGGREKPWHQDKAFFDYDLAAPVVGVWIALDAATPANGCMHVIPGSHREGPADHFARRDWQICDDAVATDRAMAVPLGPGGALFFDGYLHHGTPANRTSTRRRALQFHYARTDIGVIEDDERLAVFGAEGRGAQC